MPHKLPCIAVMIQVSNKFDCNSGGYVQHTIQKWPKIVLSAGMKKCEIWKLGNYKSDINETWPRHLPTQNLSHTKS